MTRLHAPALGALTAAVLLPASALAELTAEQVWADWQGYMESTGYTVEATQTPRADGLTVSDLVLSVVQTEPDNRFEMRIDQVVFDEQGDGTVRITWPDTMPLSLSGTAMEGESYDLQLSYGHDGHEMTAAGTPDDLSYEYAAPSIDLRLVSAEVDGEVLPPEMAKLALSLTAVTSTMRMQGEGLLNYAQDLAAEFMTYDLAFQDPATQSSATVNGQLTGLNFKGTAALPDTVDLENVAQNLAAGFAMQGAFTFSSGQSSTQMRDAEQSLEWRTRSKGGDFEVAIDENQLAYGVEQSGSEISIISDQAPFPIDIRAERSGVRLQMPIVPAETPQDFAARLLLDEFTISDAMWQMLDPSGALPRDPASLTIDLGGMASVKADFLDPEVADQMALTGEAPGQLESLRINEVLLSIAGAKLQGDGAFAFDNDRPGPLGGLPAPTGALNLSVTGANALLDKLIQMGLLTNQDAMGARMMMGLLAVPGDAPDTLTSTIEINEQGHILANGQRIQ